ncbi:hypothetical protein ACJX0J_021029, partial [Zea mays]
CCTIQGNALADRLILDVFLGTCLQECSTYLHYYYIPLKHGQINNGFFVTAFENGVEQVFVFIVSLFDVGTIYLCIGDVLVTYMIFVVWLLVIDKAKLLDIYDMHNTLLGALGS